MIWILFTITRVNNHNARKSLDNLAFRPAFPILIPYVAGIRTPPWSRQSTLCYAWAFLSSWSIFSKWNQNCFQTWCQEYQSLEVNTKILECVYLFCILKINKKLSPNLLVIKHHLTLAFLHNIHITVHVYISVENTYIMGTCSYIFTDRIMLLTCFGVHLFRAPENIWWIVKVLRFAVEFCLSFKLIN